MITCKWLVRCALVALALCGGIRPVAGQDAAESATSAVSTSSATHQQEEEEEESTWGRIYLRNGVAPIQYFRSTFGSAMIDEEIELVFPHRNEDQLGCELLPEEEQAYIAQQNRSIGLIVQRGECPFTQKARHAARMGASVLIVVSNTEDTERPRGVVADEEDAMENTITTVMVRHSAGELMLAASKRGDKQLFAKLVPMKCERQPYVCTPRSKEDEYYIDAHQMNAGIIITTKTRDQQQEQEHPRDEEEQVQENERQTPESGETEERVTRFLAGEFLSATFGGPFVNGPLEIAPFPIPSDGCEPLENGDSSTASPGRAYENKLVVLETSSRCSDLHRVRAAQDAGASVALIVVNISDPFSFRKMVPPTVTDAWMGYDVHIASATISTQTAQNLLGAKRVFFQGENELAREWDELHKLMKPNRWPVKKKKQVQKVRKTLKKHGKYPEKREFLKMTFLHVAGGSQSTWQELEQQFFESLEQAKQRQEQEAMVAQGSTPAPASKDSVTLGSSTHEEL